MASKYAGYKITKEDILNGIDFLEVVKDKCNRSERFDVNALAVEHGLPRFNYYVKAMKKLNYITPRGEKKTEYKFIYPGNIEKVHARRLINEALDMYLKNVEETIIKNREKKLTKNRITEAVLDTTIEPIILPTNKMVEVETPEVKDTIFKVKSAKRILYEEAVIELAGFRIKGTFELEKI